MSVVKIGIVGCGDISGIYLENITNMFKEIEIIGVCDLIREKAEYAREKYDIPKIYEDMYEVFADPEVDIVLNLTRPYEHYGVTSEALKAGKNVYSEKPLGATLEEGTKLVELAKEKDLLIGGAPDTFLGAGIQTCRKLIDDGFIGDVVGATAFMTNRGHESWHPDPEFYYKHGGGPMMDMGPYYVTALVSMLGSVEAITGMGKASFPQRTITSEPKYGTIVDVEVPTYTMGLMKFTNGVIGSIFTTFDVCKAEVPIIEIYGSEGTLSVPDPNTFGGEVKVCRRGETEFKEIPYLFKYPENSRALGLADMAKAIQTERKYRANSDLTYHVLEIMTAIEKSGKEACFVNIESRVDRPVAMCYDMMDGVLD